MPRGRRSNVRRRKLTRRARRGRSSVPRMPLIADKNQSCRIVETIEFADLSGNHAYSAIFNLGEFPRAFTLAPHFQWYKATHVKYTYTPLFNVFDDGAGQASKPYMYTMMNRSQQSFTTGTHLSDFQAAGARPLALTTTKEISYKPNWCQIANTAIRTTPSVGQDFATVGYTPNYGWLATPISAVIVPSNTGTTDTGTYLLENPAPGGSPPGAPYILPFNLRNNVIYNGHLTFMDQTYVGAAPSNAIAKVTCQVTWVFKGAKNSLPWQPPGVTEVPKAV